MPISFQLAATGDYFISRWTGVICGDELLASYRRFLQQTPWACRNELVDLRQADPEGLETWALLDLAEMAQRFFRQQGVEEIRTAVVAPSLWPQRLVDLYSAFTYDSPEQVALFEQREEAVAWLSRSALLDGVHTESGSAQVRCA